MKIYILKHEDFRLDKMYIRNSYGKIVVPTEEYLLQACPDVFWDAFIESLQEAFGNFPRPLSYSDIPVLEGLSPIFKLNASSNPYLKIVDSIREYGRIKVFLSTPEENKLRAVSK